MKPYLSQSEIDADRQTQLVQRLARRPARVPWAFGLFLFLVLAALASLYFFAVNMLPL